MKMYQIINAVPAFGKLGNSDMKMSDAYKVQKMLSTLQTEIDFFNEKKLALAQKYGTVNGDGSVDIPKENQAEAQAALGELMNIDVQAEFKVIKIPINDNIELTANDIGFLAPFVEFYSAEGDLF